MGRFKNWLKSKYKDYRKARLNTDAIGIFQSAISGEDKYKNFDNEKLGNVFGKTEKLRSGIGKAGLVGLSVFGANKLKGKDMLTDNQIEGKSGNTIANAPKKWDWAGIKQIGGKFFDTYGKEILGKELEAIKTKIKGSQKGGTVFGSDSGTGNTVLSEYWNKFRYWIGRNWKVVLAFMLGLFLFWYFFLKKKRGGTVRRRRFITTAVRRTGQSRNPSKRSKQLAALAKGRRTRMRNLRAKKRK
jgi:hypothetical protein